MKETQELLAGESNSGQLSKCVITDDDDDDDDSNIDDDDDDDDDNAQMETRWNGGGNFVIN